MSGKTAHAAEQDSPTYTFSLRIKHPSIDPDEITRALGVTPDHAWACGEPRRSEGGLTLGGTRRNSYWSATLPGASVRELAEKWAQHKEWRTAAPVPPQIPPALIPVSSHLALQLVLLRRHRALFERLSAEGGEVSLVIDVEPSAGTTVVIEPTLARQIADLGVRLEFQLE